VLTISQVHQIVDAATTMRITVYFWTVYSLGLRMQEGLNLQVGDIDATRGMVHVHRGKGAKDRYVPLPTSTLQLLRQYWVTHRHKRLSPSGTARCSRRSPVDGPVSWAVSSIGAKAAVESIGWGALAATGTARLAAGARRPGGWKSRPAACCRCTTSWSPSRCPTRSARCCAEVSGAATEPCSMPAVGDGQAVLKYLAPYVNRVAISDNRIVACNEASVTFRYTPSGAKRSKIRSVSGTEFVRGFLQHTLPRGFQKIRYYGWMSPNHRLRFDELKWLVWLFLGWTFRLASGQIPQTAPPEPGTVRCPECGGLMRIVAVCYQPRTALPEHSIVYLDSG
jgi:hypothetical protein